MSVTRYSFAGNRFFVLERMLEQGLQVGAIFAVAGSYLERALAERGIAYEAVGCKKELIAGLEAAEFDTFVSNGCPFILPISRLQGGSEKRFINIHPSYLPDLRGADPVPGALLYGRDSGATCHLMNDDIDAGDIIARIRIPNTPDLDCGLLYQLTFKAEREVFDLALERDFEPDGPQQGGKEDIYYTLKPEHLVFSWQQDSQSIMNRIRAYGTRGQGARFVHAGVTFIVRDAEMVDNPFLMGYLDQYQQNEVVYNYEGMLLVRKDRAFLKLKRIDGELDRLPVGTLLGAV